MVDFADELAESLCIGVEIDEQETGPIINLDRLKGTLGGIEPFDPSGERGADEVAVQVISPAVIGTRDRDN